MDLFWHDDALRHDTGSGLFEQPPSPLPRRARAHPENAVRVRNMKAILERGPLAADIRRRDGRHAALDELSLVHEEAYVESVRDWRRRPHVVDSGPRRVLGCGARGRWTTLAACKAVLSGETDVAYALVRPPGHHAQPAQADTASTTWPSRQSTRVDKDRPGGDPRLGRPPRQRDAGAATSTSSPRRCHAPRRLERRSTRSSAPEELGEARHRLQRQRRAPPGTGDGGYLRAFDEIVAPIDSFDPGLVLVACGQDANQFDPNGKAKSMEGFRQLGEVTGRSRSVTRAAG